MDKKEFAGFLALAKDLKANIPMEPKAKENPNADEDVKNPQEKVMSLAREKMNSDKTIALDSAISQVLKENKKLAQLYEGA